MKNTFQKRHFEAIAETLRETKPQRAQREVREQREGDAEQWALVVEAFADAGERWSSNFKRERFLEACGVDEVRSLDERENAQKEILHKTLEEAREQQEP